MHAGVGYRAGVGCRVALSLAHRHRVTLSDFKLSPRRVLSEVVPLNVQRMTAAWLICVCFVQLGCAADDDD